MPSPKLKSNSIPAEPSPVPYIAIGLALLAGGFFLFRGLNSAPQTSTVVEESQTSAPSAESANPKAARSSNRSFSLPRSLPAGTQVQIDGSTSMVTINQNLKQAFEQQYRGTTVETRSGGSNQGIRSLLAGDIDLAAISRPLSAAEQSQGLRAVSIASDPIALVVGVNNPFKGELSSQQVEAIFKGSITNWASVGGPNQTLRVINRPDVSGTHQAFKELVLKKDNFGLTPNIQTLKEDATTPLLRALGNDGIGYATYSQVVNQRTVRPVAIDGALPGNPSYRYNRNLYYVYKEPASPKVQAFLAYALSNKGKAAIFRE